MSVEVKTQHNDNDRSGANLNETILIVHNVSQQTFGKLFEMPVDGHVYAQPLYLPGVAVPGKGTHNIVYVATMNNSVFAFDAESGTQLWSKTLEPSVTLPDDTVGGGHGYRDIQERIGIIGTPVISTEHEAIYVVTFSKAAGEYSHHLHALQLATGDELFGGPRRIEAVVAGTGPGSVAGQVNFQSVLQNQRPGLLLNQGKVYIAFASYGDFSNYHGWVLGFDAATLQPMQHSANLTPNARAGGIWQAGQGPSADAEGNVYVLSGNGDFNERSLAGKITMTDTALGGPAVANINDNQIALAWTGNEALRRLNVAFSNDGRQFGGKQILTDTSLDGPALCFGNGRLFLAWTGPDAAQHVNVMSSGDLQTFGNKVVLNELSPFGPALAFGNGRVFLAWVGREALQRLNVMSSADGVHWEHKVTLNEQGAAAPALSFINGKLYLLWVGTDPNRQLNIMESTDGITFTNKVTLTHSSEFHPALAYEGRLALAWTGVSQDLPLELISGSNTADLGNTQTYNDRSAAGTALVMFKGKLYILWTGNEAQRRLNIAEVSHTPSLGDCFVKLRPDLTIADWFTPWNTLHLNDIDNDLGSGGILQLPGTNLMTGGGKEGILYLIDRNHLGRFCSTCDSTTGERNIVQSFQATASQNDPHAPEPAAEAGGYHHIHGSPVYWDSPNRGPVIYVWGEADRLRAFQFKGGKLTTTPVDMSSPTVVTPARSMPGAMLSLSANGKQAGTGILWASHPTKEDANQGAVDGTLNAIDASDLSRVLWTSDQAPGGRDTLGKVAKFTPPTVANGRVYAATFSHKVVAYGLLG